MKVFYTARPVLVLESNLKKCAEWFLADPLFFHMRPLDDGQPHVDIPLEPGFACFFVGGRGSLREALARQNQIKLTTNGMGLGVAVTTHIKAGIKSISNRQKPQNNEEAKLVAKVQKLRHKTLTLIMVYNTYL